MDKSETVQDIQQRLNELRSEAEDEGLVLVASWQDDSGNMQSMQFDADDLLYVAVRQ